MDTHLAIFSMCGVAGCGKSFLLNCLLKAFDDNGVSLFHFLIIFHNVYFQLYSSKWPSNSRREPSQRHRKLPNRFRSRKGPRVFGCWASRSLTKSEASAFCSWTSRASSHLTARLVTEARAPERTLRIQPTANCSHWGLSYPPPSASTS